MTRTSPLKNDFSGGELGDFVHGRTGTDRFNAGVALCRNFVPTLAGPVKKRVGTYFGCELRDSSRRARLIRFEFSVFQAYMLIFEHLFMRVMKNGELVTLTAKNITAATKANPCVITSNGHGYSNGTRVLIKNVGGMLQLNNREFRVANVAANTFELQDAQSGANVNSTAFDTYTSGGTVAAIFELAIPYTESDLQFLQFIQSNDIMTIVHPDHAPAEITRTSDTAWTRTAITFVDGPYLDENDTAITLTLGGTSGVQSLTASAALFVGTDAGRLVRIKHGSTWGYGVLTGVSSSTVATIDIKRNFAASTAVTTWRLGLWSATTGYPACVSFFQVRRVFSGTDAMPNREDFSVSNDFDNFMPTAADGTVTDANALAVVLDSNEINGISWMVPTDKGLAEGTTGGEFLTAPNSQTSAITPTDVTAKQMTFYGSAAVTPARAGRSILYLQRSARRVLEMAFFIESDGFQSADLSALNEDATLSGIREMIYTKEPDPVLWACRTDGTLVGMTFSRDADALRAAWHQHQLGGSSTAGGDAPLVESVSAIPSPDASYDELWMIGKRWINGRVVRTVEAVDRPFDKNVWQHNAFFVDCGLTLDTSVAISGATKANPVVITTSSSHGIANGEDVFITEVTGMTELNGRHFTAANVTGTTLELSGVNGTAYGTYGRSGKIAKRVQTVSGLSHLEGQTVAILGDGGVQAQKTVTGGAITLANKAAFVHVGLPYVADLQLLPFETGSATGTSEGKKRKLEHIAFRLWRTCSLKYGQAFDASMFEINFRTGDMDAGLAPEMFTGVKKVLGGQKYDLEGKLCLRSDDPLPCAILSIAPQITTQDR